MPAEMELTGTVDNGYISGGNVCITKPGSTAKVKVIYHTYKYENGSEVGVVDVTEVQRQNIKTNIWIVLSLLYELRTIYCFTI